MAKKYVIGKRYPVLDAKDPVGALDYSIDWVDWLQTGETITTSLWVSDVGITIDSDLISANLTVVKLSGGTLNQQYKISNTITTDGGANGRTTKRSFYLPIKEL